MLPFLVNHFHVKNLRYRLIPSTAIDDQRILQSDWTKVTNGHTQSKVLVSDAALEISLRQGNERSLMRLWRCGNDGNNSSFPLIFICGNDTLTTITMNNDDTLTTITMNKISLLFAFPLIIFLFHLIPYFCQ